MELIDVDTQHAYDIIREKIISLQLAPGGLVMEQQLAEKLHMSAESVREALKLLAHDQLIIITPRHGIYTTDVNLPDLEQISEVRLVLEPFCAELAAQRATADDLTVLEALRKEQAATASDDGRRLLEVDHKFHQAIVRAAKNKHLVQIMEHFFGLSQRFWHLALPHLDILPMSVAEHSEMVASIKGQDADRARHIMYHHVKEFYNRVRIILNSNTTL